MSQEPLPEPVTPQPGLPRTIGVLNLVFGFILLLWGGLSLFVLGPFLVENNPFQLDPVMTRHVVEGVRRDLIETLRSGEKTAGDEAEKRRLSSSRVALESAQTDLAKQVDFGAINRNLPWVSRYLWVDTVSGPALNLLMVVSGVGLLLLSRWGRSMAVLVAALKLLRLLGVSILLAVAAVPAVATTTGKLVRTDVGKAVVKGASGASALPSVQLDPDEFVRIVAALGYGYALMSFGLGAIYPLIVLIVLRRPGAVAACSGSARGPIPAGPDAQ
jgi:hypothetical protein